MPTFIKMKQTTWFIMETKSRAVVTRDWGGGEGRKESEVIV